MQADQRFAVSVHILTLLADSGGPLTSEVIASSVDTHPVVIRRVMGHLRRHGLVTSRPGVKGGWQLRRTPGRISLREVYQTVNHAHVLALHRHPDPHCRVGGRIQASLGDVFENAQQALEGSLARVTIADMLHDVRARHGRRV